MTPDALEALLRSRLRLRAFPEFGDLRLWLAHPGSRLAALSERFEAGAPYWGFPWPGGLALVQHLRANPASVRGRRVFDYGSGCGLVGIVAHLCGAAGVGFSDANPLAAAASRLNAAENGLMPAEIDATALGPGDVVVAGDVFYDAGAAAESLKQLTGFRTQGADVLIGDPYRPDLPRAHLVEIARTDVREVGAPPSAPEIAAGVFTLPPDAPAS